MIIWLLAATVFAAQPDWDRGAEILARIAAAPEPCPPTEEGRRADKELYDQLGKWLGPLRTHDSREVRVRARVVGLAGVMSLADRLQRGDDCCADCYESALWTLDRRAFDIEQSLVRDVSDAVRMDAKDGPTLCELVPRDLINPLRMGCEYSLGPDGPPPAPLAEPEPIPRAVRMAPPTE